ncbi:MAG: cbb3-type cytochrome c oxidase subunit 3 [Acidibrevibacterium sp.]|jgi:cbb3-type cytochrome oxidase subunit 3|nr:cbb3-type cytochrome c oxidase subunit 3 [Acidibrevibacterium fodinaquatile]MCA7120705.1 cbb3-type cytochrome c oxidase subunit 3 [Acidibrevibacterium fodinaquatile]
MTPNTLHTLQGYLLLAAVFVFAVLFITVYWPRNKAEIERHALIPLDDDR